MSLYSKYLDSLIGDGDGLAFLVDKGTGARIGERNVYHCQTPLPYRWINHDEQFQIYFNGEWQEAVSTDWDFNKQEPPHILEPFWLENGVTCEASFNADEDMVEVYVGGYYLGSIKAKGISSEAQKEIGLQFM